MNPINNNSNISFAGGRKPFSLANAITAMTRADALAPIIALEATVTGGRTIQAYKRGGKEEARERIIEETTGAIVWLWGVDVLNKQGDKILSRYLGTPGTNFDVGTDKVLRTPFKNYMKDGVKRNISQNKVAALKGLKVVTSVLIANLFIGFVVPKINHYITNVILRDEKQRKIAVKEEEKAQKANETISDKKAESKDSPSFKGSAVSAINVFTNAIENTNTGKLLSTDVGITGGRMINARTKEERNEIAFRDIGSIYFYMWARGHVTSLFNLAESGRTTRLNPNSVNILNDHLLKFLDSKGGSLPVEEFKRLTQGVQDSAIKLPEGIKFEEGTLSWVEKLGNKFRKQPVEPLKVAKVKDLESIIKDENILSRIREMSKLQPLREGEAVITKQQIIDAYNVAEINNPKLLSNAFSQFTGGKGKVIGRENGKEILSKTEFTGGAYIDKYRYVSNKKLYNLKSQMNDYISDICKMSKDGKVTKELLNKAKSKNIMYNGINFITAFAIAATFLSTIIPKMQYRMTQKRTGLNVFPGTYDYEHHKRVDAD